MQKSGRRFQMKPSGFLSNKKARDGTRTRGLDLGKVALHQLSHSRILCFEILLSLKHRTYDTIKSFCCQPYF